MRGPSEWAGCVGWVRGLGARTSGPHAPAQGRFEIKWGSAT